MADAEVHKVRTSEEVVAWLLLLVALPHIIGNPFRAELLPHVSEGDVEVFVTVILDTFGYYALYRAITVSQRAVRRRRLLCVPLVVYWLLNLTFSGQQLYHRVALGQTDFEMSDPMRYAFAAIKVITVITFVPAVVAPYEPFSELDWPGRFWRFIHHSPQE
jgi:hypothetical protein